MAKFRYLIDFDYFNNNDYDCENISDNEDKYIIGKDNDDIPYYIDHLIEHKKSDRKFVNDQINHYIKFIEFIRCQDLNTASKLKDNYLLSDSDDYRKDHFVVYKLGNYYVMFMRVEYVDNCRKVSFTMHSIVNGTLTSIWCRLFTFNIFRTAKIY